MQLTLIWYLVRRTNNLFAHSWLIIGGLVCLFPSSPAFAIDKCPSYRPITSLRYSIKPTQYVRNFSAMELTGTHEYGDGSSITLGHAGGRSGIRMSIEYEAVLHASLYCLQIKKIKAQFYAEPTIHIANNFKRGSCEYNSVLKHEHKHVKILQRAHKLYISKYRTHLRKVAKGIPYFPPMEITEMQAYKDIASRHIDNGLSEYMAHIRDYVAERQKELDTPEEYQRVNERCKRWDKKLKDD